MYQNNKLAYSEFFALLVQDEVARREHEKINLRLQRAGFRGEKTLEGFDFAFNSASSAGTFVSTGASIKEMNPPLAGFPRVRYDGIAVKGNAIALSSSKLRIVLSSRPCVF